MSTECTVEVSALAMPFLKVTMFLPYNCIENFEEKKQTPKTVALSIVRKPPNSDDDAGTTFENSPENPLISNIMLNG